MTLKMALNPLLFFLLMTPLFSTVYDPNTSAEDLNNELQFTKPAEEVIFSRKLNHQDHPPILFDSIMVKQVNEHKHLGLTLHSKLTFTKHITEKISKAKKGVGVIKYLSSYVPIKTLDQIWLIRIRSLC